MNSGIKIIINKGFLGLGKKELDILELDDVQFLSVIVNSLKSFNWNDEGVGLTLMERVVTTYLKFIFHNPEKKNQCRISAILALEEMGKRFVKNEHQWEACLRELGLVKE
jgi:hypothetical protein